MPHVFRTATVSLLAALVLIGCAATRPAASAASPAVAGDARVERFRQQVESNRERLGIPGLSVAVIENGQLLWTEGFGYADVENRVPVAPDTLFHLASVTKTFTAILTLQLVEQGKLDLDAPVSRYVPEIKDDRVRIKHLLSHTSEGMPGEAFNYNPERFEHLKTIIEQVTGKPLRQVFVESFLDPLGMRDSVPGPDVVDDPAKWAVLGASNLERYRQVLPRLAKPYTYYGDGEIVRTTSPEADFWASAGLLSTARDMAKYDAAVDRHVFLSPTMQQRAWTPFLSNAGKPLPGGLGWFATDYRGERLVWHFGHWGTGYSAMYLKIPARHLTVVMLANSEALADHHYQVGEEITHNIMGCDFIDTFVPEVSDASYRSSLSPAALATELQKARDATPKHPYAGPSPDCERTSRIALEEWIADRRSQARTIVPLDPALAAVYAGRYQFPTRVAAITDEGGRLFLAMADGTRSELFAQSPAQLFLKIRPWTMTFVRKGGKVVRIDLLDRGDTYKLARVP